ncbi:hypothetical protein LSUE1_G004344 [Lachnellula suecica]|uniref:Apple domain-containing protein n=1 Tax=Lachnellula suecica TaxID=602035 RepID=A0A8T9BYE7_9HELO|nr:hypothetical protein LSUE1_G004344 [Lachnellula suecica]
MRFPLLLSLVSGALGSLHHRDVCTTDNCARAVQGTKCRLEASSIPAIRSADCSSFMIETITPATPTVTSTVTTPNYSIIGSNAKRIAAAEVNNMGARNDLDFILLPPTPIHHHAVGVAPRHVTQLPSKVPAYARACAGSSSYSSACSCGGITMTTTFAPTPAAVTTTISTGGPVIPVCDASKNFGFQHLGGTIAPGIGLAVSTQAATSDAECCASCFAPGSKCFVYEHFNGNCITVTETSGSNTPTDACPFGVFEISSPGNGSFYGNGPCAIFVD